MQTVTVLDGTLTGANYYYDRSLLAGLDNLDVASLLIGWRWEDLKIDTAKYEAGLLPYIRPPFPNPPKPRNDCETQCF